MVVVDAEGGGDVGDEEEGDGPNDGIAVANNQGAVRSLVATLDGKTNHQKLGHAIRRFEARNRYMYCPASF